MLSFGSKFIKDVLVILSGFNLVAIHSSGPYPLLFVLILHFVTMAVAVPFILLHHFMQNISARKFIELNCTDATRSHSLTSACVCVGSLSNIYAINKMVILANKIVYI